MKDKGGETGASSENPGEKSPDNEFDREFRVAEQQKSAEKETTARVEETTNRDPTNLRRKVENSSTARQEESR